MRFLHVATPSEACQSGRETPCTMVEGRQSKSPRIHYPSYHLVHPPAPVQTPEGLSSNEEQPIPKDPPRLSTCSPSPPPKPLGHSPRICHPRPCRPIGWSREETPLGRYRRRSRFLIDATHREVDPQHPIKASGGRGGTAQPHSPVTPAALASALVTRSRDLGRSYRPRDTVHYRSTRKPSRYTRHSYKKNAFLYILP